MDFALREEQQDIQSLARQILGDFSAPERLRKLETDEADIDRELWAALAEAGLLGIAIDETLGGMGFDFESLCVLLEEAGRAVPRAPLLPVLVGAALPLQRFGSDAQRQRWLPGIASGRSLLTAARVEPDNEDPLRPRTLAETEDDGLRVSGTKQLVPAAAGAEAIILAAQLGDDPVVVLVERDSAGLSLEAQRVTCGETWYRLQLDNVAVPEEAVLARGDHARLWLLWTEQRYRTALCATAVGLCDAMMRMTASYTAEREQFGRPVATFQAVSHRMADCYIDVECLRVVTQQAIYQLCQSADASDAVDVAKTWCGDVCHRVSQAAQHCHGGIGVDRDYPLFRYCLWARQIELTAGSSARLREVIGRRIAEQGRNGA